MRFYGFCRDIHELIQLADLSVASSIREGLGMNLLEGMAAEKPVVAADNRGHREIIEDGVNGFLVPKQGTARHLPIGLKSCTDPRVCEKQWDKKGAGRRNVFQKHVR